MEKLGLTRARSRPIASYILAPGRSAIIEIREVRLPHHMAVVMWHEHWRRGKTMHHLQLSVNVSDTLTLDAGWWEETMEETASGKPLPCRLIHPPEPTMYDQVLRHLETISRETRILPKSQLNFGEVALATIAVCLRWGTYFAVLADRTKPIWPQTEQKEISMIGDEEMARINIEVSAALAQWIEQMTATFGKWSKRHRRFPCFRRSSMREPTINCTGLSASSTQPNRARASLRCSKNNTGKGGSNRNGRISCPTLLAGLPTD